MSNNSGSQTALATLHDTYIDSDGEIESDGEGTGRNKYLTPSRGSFPSSTDNTFKEKPLQTKLVAYATEGIDYEMSDSEYSKSSSSQQDESSESRAAVSENPPPSPVSFHRSFLNLKKNEIQLPPEPPGRCSKSQQEHIRKLYERKKLGEDMYAFIQRRKDLRNPSMNEALIQFCDVDQQDTNYPSETYDPHCWGPESFYEELRKRQNEEMDKRRKKKEKTKVEFMSGTDKKTSNSIRKVVKRKSRWDVGINQMPVGADKPAALVAPSVLPVPTGTKSKVISAFGTITKKDEQ